MNIHTFVSPSHERLIPLFLEGCKREPLIEPTMHRVNIETGNGDYDNAGWRDCNVTMPHMALEIMQVNMGRTIGFLDVDVAVLRPLISDVSHMALGLADFLFQHEQKELFNPGVMFVNCSYRTLAAWDKWIDLMQQWDGHLPCQNRLMLEAFWPHCQIGILPNMFANPSNGGALSTAMLFHANCTPPPDSVGQKFRMMREALDL